MTNLIKILKSFNRKERFFLIQGAAGKEAFSLSEDYRQKLACDIGIDEIPSNAFVAMDYHLDWLHASLFLACDKTDEEGPFCNDIEVSSGTQQDIDLLVAFKSEEDYHLILVEAKAYGSWDNKQLTQKSKRLRKIFGNDTETAWPNVKPFFYMTSPRQPRNKKRPEWPGWMTDKGSIRWFKLCVPASRLKVTGCDKDGESTDERPYFKIEKV